MLWVFSFSFWCEALFEADPREEQGKPGTNLRVPEDKQTGHAAGTKR